MRLNRFYVGAKRPRLIQNFGQTECWVQDKDLMHQWGKVLRFQVGDELALFDDEIELIYKITEIKPIEYGLVKVTETQRREPQRKVILAWSLIKKDNNDWVIQKATELGVSHLVPVMAERREKTGFDVERALKIVIEAAEQCGRATIPLVSEPRSLSDVIGEFKATGELFVADMGAAKPSLLTGQQFAVLIGPEGGWSDKERALFTEHELPTLGLGDFTLRAETAAITAVHELMS